MLFVGNDWSVGHHDVCLMNKTREWLAARRLGEGPEGMGQFHEMVSEWVDDPSQVVVGVETDRGLWIEALVAAGYRVYAINPRSVARYRERHSVSGAKSDRRDAKLLADLVRTDRHNPRQVADHGRGGGHHRACPRTSEPDRRADPSRKRVGLWAKGVLPPGSGNLRQAGGSGHVGCSRDGYPSRPPVPDSRKLRYARR